MTGLRIDLDDERRWHLPGGLISGRAVWSLGSPANIIELRLFWHTTGKGTEDVEIVRELRIDDPGERGERGFGFELPLGPYSFSGSLITLGWALELVVLPSGETERVELVVAPTPVEVRLEPLGREPLGHAIRLGRGS